MDFLCRYAVALLCLLSPHPSIDFLPVPHLHHQDKEDFVPNLINDAVVLPRSHIDAVELLLRLQLLDSMRARIFFQTENVPVHVLADVRIELAEVPLSGGSDFDAIRQDSVSQVPHEVSERNGPFLFRLFQGGACIFEVDSVHFLPGQALQKAEVIYGNNGGQVLPTAGDDGPFLPIGGAVYDVGKLFPRFRNVEACHV